MDLAGAASPPRRLRETPLHFAEPIHLLRALEARQTGRHAMADKEAAKHESQDDERTIARIEEGPKEAGYPVAGDDFPDIILPEKPAPEKAVENDA